MLKKTDIKMVALVGFGVLVAGAVMAHLPDLPLVKDARAGYDQ